MSFLNSIISTIDGPTANGSRPVTQAPKSSAATRADLRANTVAPDARASAAKLMAASNASSSLKVPKANGSSSTSANPSRSSTASPAPRASIASAPKPSPAGAARPAQANGAAPSRSSSVQSNVKPSMPAQSATSASKKGGYLAMLEKAKEMQDAAKAKATGQIKHHKVEKERLTKREKERRIAEAKMGSKQPPRPVKSGPVNGVRKVTAPSKPGEVKRKIETSYKGTMRNDPPPQPAYRGTMGGSAAATVKPRNTASDAKGVKSGAASRYRYAEDDEDEEMDEDEDMEEYDSASSDMEAGRDDIDEEEIMSSRLARKEDEEALREENELKRQKLERKRKLEALSAAAAKKKKVY